MHLVEKLLLNSQISLEESGGCPEIVEFHVNNGSLESVKGSIELAPANPNLLSSRVHHNVVVIASSMEASHISEHGLGSN